MRGEGGRQRTPGCEGERGALDAPSLGDGGKVTGKLGAGEKEGRAEGRGKRVE